MTDRPKYSVIIPSRNGCKYLPFAIRSVLEQRCEDFELIVSDNHSSDDTWAFLSTLSDPRLRTFQPPEALSMARHFEFAIGKARGEWITVLGDDDGLQPYFFELAEKLTFASLHPVISSSRAYYYWAGCEAFHSGGVVGYAADGKISTRNSLCRLLRLLLFTGPYFEEPQFYTGTLFRRELYETIRDLQGGTVFKTTIMDANSVALIFTHAPQFTFCQIPLAWIGSSPKSNGLAQTAVAQSGTSQADGETKKLVNDFDSLNLKDKVPSSSRFPFSAYIHSVDAYFLEAFYQVHCGSGSTWESLLNFKPATYILFGKIHREYARQKDPGVRQAYRATFAANGLNPLVLNLASRIVSCADRIDSLTGKVLRRLSKIALDRRRTDPATPQNQPGGRTQSAACALSSDSRSDFPTILDASAKTRELYDTYLS